MSLNSSQRVAVEHRGSPLLVLAGAGTGKTRVITHRVAALLREGVPAWRILAVTFTNKAAAEMRERTARLCHEQADVGQLWIGTFHSICARILRRMGEPVGLSPRFSIYDTDDQRSTMSRVLKEMGVSDRLFSARAVLGHIDRAKNRGLGPEEVDALGLNDPVRSVVHEAYQRYEAVLRASDAADFGDLLLLTVRLLRRAGQPNEGSQLGDFDPVVGLRRRFRHIVVDEFQDTNPIQTDLIDQLGDEAELCVVGDDDQAIYGWRGAEVEQILGFSDRHPGTEVVRLEQNYRSTENILTCADAIIQRNAGRLGKTLWSELGVGDPVRVLSLIDERDEARLVAKEIQAAVQAGSSPEDFAVFYRTHAQSRVLEDELRRTGLGCRIVGGVAFYERAEVKDLLAYLTLLVNPNSDAHLVRVINRPARGIGKTSVGRLQAYASERGVSLWETLSEPEAAGLKKAAAGRVRRFHAMIAAIAEQADQQPMDELAAQVLEETGYRETLAEDDTEESMARLENLQELMGNMVEFAEARPDATLPEYLELVSLVTSEDQARAPGGAVSLMTVHSAKGLEFGHVYLTGMEERVFPHARVLDDPRQLEEERRLAYVAVTRAKQNLTITSARHRRIYGQMQVGMPSRFTRDLPEQAVLQSGGRPSRASIERRTPSPRWDDDIEYDSGYGPDMDPTLDGVDFDGIDEHAEGTSVFVGMAIRHDRFGEGEVLGWSGAGRDLKLQLRFPGVGTKTILARFCQPA